mmetsp:Transcript_434/g.1519  ORF Transcript_434/g.1519 Transcript_434/m.1519 type:complete len:249 (+) Transcript_434:610-1356(+)
MVPQKSVALREQAGDWPCCANLLLEPLHGRREGAAFVTHMSHHDHGMRLIKHAGWSVFIISTKCILVNGEDLLAIRHLALHDEPEQPLVGCGVTVIIRARHVPDAQRYAQHLGCVVDLLQLRRDVVSGGPAHGHQYLPSCQGREYRVDDGRLASTLRATEDSVDALQSKGTSLFLEQPGCDLTNFVEERAVVRNRPLAIVPNDVTILRQLRWDSLRGAEDALQPIEHRCRQMQMVVLAQQRSPVAQFA